MQIIMNKIFTGEYLEDNLGHELVNFIVDDTNKRYIYVGKKLVHKEDIYARKTNKKESIFKRIF